MVVVAVVATLLSYGALYGDKIYPGVSIANTDVSGQTEMSARDLLEARASEYLDVSELSLRYGDRRWRTTPREIGLNVDVDRTIERGYNVGREGGPIDRLVQSIAALARGHEMPPVFFFDNSAEKRVLERVAADIDRPAVDARLLVEVSGAIRIVPAKSGLRLDVDATTAQIERSFQIFSTHELQLVVADVPPNVSEADLIPTEAGAEAMISQPLVIKHGQKSWSLQRTDLARMLVFNPAQGSGPKLVAALDGARLKAFLSKIAPDIDVAPQNASIKYAGGQFIIKNSVDGTALDVDAAAVAIGRELARGNHTVTPVLKPVRAAITEDDLVKVRATAEAIIGQPFEVSYQDDSWTLTRQQLAGMLTFSQVETDGRQRIEAGLDKEDLGAFIGRIAGKVNKKPRDARFSFANGKISVISESVDGVTVYTEETVKAINAAAAADQHQANVVVEVVKPKVQDSDAANIVIKDLLASASTSYAGGIAARNHNVELATRRLNGAVVPPGETLSMNAALGPTTLASGFKIGYGIAIKDGSAVTVESVGGGICQVATTLFHSAFWSGLEIVERQPHLYWIPRYGQPPKGMKGLDATVDDPYVDLKIKNNTGNWIAIQSYTADWKVYFSIYGVDPGWKVTADGPYLTNRVAADTTMVEEEDPSMPEGSSLLVEHAEDGFDSSVVRHVVQDGKEIDRYVVNSHYRPSRNVILVPKKTEPTPTPTATPTPGGTPSPTATSAPHTPAPIPTGTGNR